ncbi:hypothetical protein FBU30_009319 [Linnemannia zychae]|nr:hypothetical protein FBU30_009319 [Linnemannia zychae]
MFARVSNSTTAVPISPFDIPEIFELLLFYLDSYTVRHSIALVCCQWRHMSKHRIVRTVTWHQGWGHLKKWKLLRQLPTATRFYYHHHSKSSEAHKVQNPFNKDVLQVLEENDSKYKEQLMRTGYWNEADHSDIGTSSKNDALS